MKPKSPEYPPSAADTRAFVASLEEGSTLEAAGRAIGYRVSAIREIFRRGRKGDAGYEQFVDAYEDVTAAQSRTVWTSIMAQVKAGDPAAIKYFHTHRLSAREKELEKVLLNDELAPKVAPSAPADAPADLDSLEKRVTAALRIAATETPEGIH